MESMTVQVLLNELETARQSLDRALACLGTVPRILNNEPRILRNPTSRNPTMKFVTENGFTIERVCEREESTSDSVRGCHFVVRGPDDEERRVTVVFAETAIQLVESSQRSTPLPLNSPFWLHCAERHLAIYLWDKNDYPPTEKLTIDQSSLPVSWE